MSSNEVIKSFTITQRPATPNFGNSYNAGSFSQLKSGYSYSSNNNTSSGKSRK